MSSVQIQSDSNPQNLNSSNVSETSSDQTTTRVQTPSNYSNDASENSLEQPEQTRQLVQDNNSSTSYRNEPTRVPGTYPPDWLPDHETDSCMACDTLFTLIKRRHHCRSCGKIFCGDCCRQKSKLLYLDNKEARVCSSCYSLMKETSSSGVSTAHTSQRFIVASSSSPSPQQTNNSHTVQGVLKNSSLDNQQSTSNNNEGFITPSSSSSTDPQQYKQVIFADGIRPGTDLSESFPYPMPSSSSSSSHHPSTSSFSLLTRQNRNSDCPSGSGQRSGSKKNRNGGKSHLSSSRTITVCDDLGYLPPIVISNNSNIATQWNSGSLEASSTSSLANIIANQFKSSGEKKTIQASMESRSCPLNGIIKFEEISSIVGCEDVITFLLLKDYYLKVKLINKTCCIDEKFLPTTPSDDSNTSKIKTKDQDQDVETLDDILASTLNLQEDKSNKNYTDHFPQYWCFTSEGLSKFGQSEIVLVLDKDKKDCCVPRDVFKVYLTLHELALRRQSLESLGNLLFQDGLFGNRDTAGLLFVRPLEGHCVKNLIIPDSKTFLFALVLQRWEVPWSKVFPMRLLLRLGHQFNLYPYPIISFRTREPVYYEVGHTIISILGDFRNFRYSITHVDGMKVMINKKTRKVLVQLNQSCYQQFNKVLDNSNNEHVLAWSCYPFSEADGHLVSVQNEDGQYETVEFYKKGLSEDLESTEVLGASFIIFSGALKVNQSGQSAKISIVEDGLLIQIQSCTMSALRDAIHFMHHFDIDCENNQDALNRVEVDWQFETT